MTTFIVHTTADAPERSRAPLAGLEQRIGFIPNLAGVLGGAPAAIAGFDALQGALRGTTLTAEEREVVGITVSLEHTCEYSMAAHSVFASMAGASDATLAALRDGAPVPDARLHALQAFAQALVRERGHVDPAPLLAAGFTRAQALEAVAQAAYTTFANLAANVAHTPVDEAFMAQAWSPAAV